MSKEKVIRLTLEDFSDANRCPKLVDQHRCLEKLNHKGRCRPSRHKALVSYSYPIEDVRAVMHRHMEEGRALATAHPKEFAAALQRRADAFSPPVDEVGIIFTEPNVLQILDGLKTQTRRLVSPGPRQTWLSQNRIGDVLRFAPSNDEHGDPSAWWTMAVGPKSRVVIAGHEMDGGHIGSVECRYGMPGDRLWVREGWGVALSSGAGWADGGATLTYRADGAQLALTKERFDLPNTVGQLKSWRASWRSPIHMHRWAARIILELTEVRAQRLQDISEADAIAEGITSSRRNLMFGSVIDYGVPGEKCVNVFGDKSVGEAHYPTAVAAYRALWESIHGAGSWSKNPWVFALTFRRLS